MQFFSFQAPTPLEECDRDPLTIFSWQHLKRDQEVTGGKIIIIYQFVYQFVCLFIYLPIIPTTLPNYSSIEVTCMKLILIDKKVLTI